MRVSAQRQPITVGVVPPDSAWATSVLENPDSHLSGTADALEWFALAPDAGSYTVGLPIVMHGVTRDGEIRELGRWDPLGGIDVTIAAGSPVVSRPLSDWPPQGIVGLYALAASVTGIPDFQVSDVSVKVSV